MYRNLLCCVMVSLTVQAMDSKIQKTLEEPTERTPLLERSEGKIDGPKEEPLFESPPEKTSFWRGILDKFRKGTGN